MLFFAAAGLTLSRSTATSVPGLDRWTTDVDFLPRRGLPPPARTTRYPLCIPPRRSRVVKELEEDDEEEE
jgi:hypothetical protein